jgi:hypothetical protein
MREHLVEKHITNGFRQAAAWLLGIIWLGLVLAGMAIAFTPSPHSPALGWTLLGLAAFALVFTMDKWAKVFPGLLAYGVLGSITMLVTGHAVNHPEVLVPPIEAVVLILFFAVVTALSFSLTKHRLTVPARIALFVFVLCFFGQAAAPRLMLPAMAIGFACLAVAWAHDRVQRYRRPKNSSSKNRGQPERSLLV